MNTTALLHSGVSFSLLAASQGWHLLRMSSGTAPMITIVAATIKDHQDPAYQ